MPANTTQHSSSSTSGSFQQVGLPKFPLTCLQTADFVDTEKVVKGKNTIIDFWTTKCTRCPDALDKLDTMAADPKYKDVQFISIVCDKLDGARHIIEKDDDPRWQNVSHYFMDHQNKERAKKLLGFKQVPFYVVLDENGAITQSGSSKQVDFDEVPGVIHPEERLREKQAAEAAAAAAAAAEAAKNQKSEDEDSSMGGMSIGSLDIDFDKLNVDDSNKENEDVNKSIDADLFDADDF
eukprot:CAMPEP_0113454028 /NCGR_PEP_ID=MMETSP0014_2-20120614/7656_1 /TAXON_ID=2857 /ORGANISM="Nitzschia sp." /LENGTH=236 /DNA_ID=CAMNT_0000345429 /DNA_START=213 /DNA_END=923 /DNA_ORIENTATION=+ /assembly_acc=CAM_ASM_000159